MEDTLWPTNQEENDSKDTHTKPESNVEDPAEEPGLCRDIPKDNTPPLDQDRSDCENMETQAVSPITIHSEETTAMAKCEEADGPQAMKLNKDSGDGPTVATEETSEIPARDDEGTLELGWENPKLLPQDQDRSDCENMETQALSPITIHSEETTDVSKCEEADGPQAMKLNKDSGDGPTVATEETSETPARDDEGTFKSGLENPKLLPQEQPALEKLVPEGNVETIGFTPQAKSTPSPVTFADNNRRILWISLLVAIVAALLIQLF